MKRVIRLLFFILFFSHLCFISFGQRSNKQINFEKTSIYDTNSEIYGELKEKKKLNIYNSIDYIYLYENSKLKTLPLSSNRELINIIGSKSFKIIQDSLLIHKITGKSHIRKLIYITDK